MNKEYDIITKGMELEEGVETGVPVHNEIADNESGEASLAGYEKVFDVKVALRPAALVPVV